MGVHVVESSVYHSVSQSPETGSLTEPKVHCLHSAGWWEVLGSTYFISVTSPTSAGMTDTPSMPSFYMGSWDLNLGPQACTARTYTHQTNSSAPCFVKKKSWKTQHEPFFSSSSPPLSQPLVNTQVFIKSLLPPLMMLTNVYNQQYAWMQPEDRKPFCHTPPTPTHKHLSLCSASWPSTYSMKSKDDIWPINISVRKARNIRGQHEIKQQVVIQIHLWLSFDIMVWSSKLRAHNIST